MASITYKPISQNDSRIYEDGKNIGEVIRQEDFANPGSFYYAVYLADDPRGSHRVPFGTPVHATVNLALETHPLFS